VHVTAPTALIGEVATVTITDAISNSLFGTLAQQPYAFATSPALVGAPV
jgi:hypothetical protein